MYKIAHIADTHIKNLKYHSEYRIVFDQLYETLRKEKVDYIIHCGDIAHTKTQISPEFVELCSDFFANLAKIAPTYIILGNHDGNLKNSSRQDAITPIVRALDIPSLHLLKNSGETLLDPFLAINVLSVFDRAAWAPPTDQSRINVAVYHGSISNCRTDLGWKMENGEDELGIFKGHDYAMLGDIHRQQYLDNAGRIWYAGSTIQQNHGETDDKGILIWEIEDKADFKVRPVVFSNPKPFKTIELTRKGRMPKGTSVPPGARLRLVSNNQLPLDVMKRAVEIAKHRFSPESITFLNRAAGERGTVDVASDFKVENLRDISVQEELIREYLEDFQPSEDMLERVFELNRKYNSKIEQGEEIARNINWSLNSFEWDSLFNYGKGNSIDFTKLNGIVGILGKNYSGKSSIIDGILYTLFNTTSKNERKNLNIINQNKDSCFAKLELQVGDKTYMVERSSEKYVKKLKGVVTDEAKTNLEFYTTNPVLDEIVSLNGITRNETDAQIRKRFGTVEDFLLTSMSSQLDSLTFIKEGSTRRKEILAKFLDLDILERKFRLAKEDSINLKALLRRIGEVDYDSDIAIAQVEKEETQKKLDGQKNKCESFKESLVGLQEESISLTNQIDSIPADRLDIKKLLETKKNLQDKIIEEKNTTQVLREQNNLFDMDLEKLNDFLTDTDIESLLDKKKDLDKFEKEYSKVFNDAKILDNNHKSKVKKIELLEEVPCGTQFPNCKFIKDAHIAAVDLPSLEVSIIDHVEKAKNLKQKIKKINSAELLMMIDKYNNVITSKNNLEIKKRDNEVVIQKCFSKIKGSKEKLEACHDKIDLYEEKKEDIQNIEKLLSDRTETELKVEKMKKKIQTCADEVNEYYKAIGSLEQRIMTFMEKKAELLNIREEYAAYDLFMSCTHSNGIAYDIIKKRLPVINEEVARVLANIVEFEVFFEDDGKRLNIFIKHPRHEARPLEMGSGAEKTIASMAIRLALLSVSSLPKGNIFILDEPGTSLDSENMEGFVRILQLIKMYFKTVILISHLDSLKDCVDVLITIDKENGYARVNQ